MVNIIASPFVMEDIEKLKNAGATSIVLGMPFFSVRASSHFDNASLQEARALCKRLDVACYVLMNRFFIEDELMALQTQLQFLKTIAIDGIYFTDMGVYTQAKKLAMEHLLIYNPDTILTNANDINAYLALGLKMCTIAKEITLEDMVSIGHKCQANLEVIIHGRLNMMHSKRNLLSHYMQFLNKDRSLQNNEHLYLKEEHRDEHMPIIEDEQGTHIFTGFTLCSFEEVDDIIQAHITNLRIESLFLSIEEVCALIQDYLLVIANPQRGRAMYQQYEIKYPQQNITKGFLYKKTGLLK